MSVLLNKTLHFQLFILIILLSILLLSPKEDCMAEHKQENSLISLPKIEISGSNSLKALLQKRRSERSFSGQEIELADLSALLYAAQGQTHPRGYRTAPSAGALYPLEVFVAAGEVSSLNPGIYKYKSKEHALAKLADGDKRQELARAALNQSWIARAPVVIVISAVYERVTAKYGQRGIQYTHMESGCAAQNICLQAVDLDLGTTLIGAFEDANVRQIIHADKKEIPLLLIPAGRPN